MFWAKYSLLTSDRGVLSSSPRAVSRTCTGNPNSKSKRQVWQTFLTLEQVWQISVFLKRMPTPGHQRNTVKGRSQTLHALACDCLVYYLVGGVSSRLVLMFCETSTSSSCYPWQKFVLRVDVLPCASKGCRPGKFHRGWGRPNCINGGKAVELVSVLRPRKITEITCLFVHSWVLKYSCLQVPIPPMRLCWDLIWFVP